jgi:hypothetical protein
MVGSMHRSHRPTSLSILLWLRACASLPTGMEKTSNLQKEINAIILEVIKEHKRIIFNGTITPMIGWLRLKNADCRISRIPSTR